MTAERPAVGIVCIGAMGEPLARHLLTSGWRVAVFIRRPGAGAELIAAGAEGVDSPAELADRASLILTALPTAPDVREVAFIEIVECTRALRQQNSGGGQCGRGRQYPERRNQLAPGKAELTGTWPFGKH